ncbi:peptidase M13 [Iodidimonas muriae]|uniref:Peptidase M13 n=1 Tax=Iodidimonas muriae TaxID=261467 RepID=A0ABQ2LES1_9PROT|nr:M13 family metallopeptidase [Iodidimonas muriae]GER07562.1 peptidase M13 [Kordiimonadales bacterium JCM 17843]GGO13933.1 peptidase M13 [Iodidimonas muriae]
MTIRALLLAGVCLGTLTACDNKPASENRETTAVEHTTATAELGTWGVDLEARNTEIDPGDDFFHYANGTWLDNFEIPADKTSYGAFTVLRDRSEERVKTIIEQLASETFEQGTIEQKIADYYASYMDQDTVNAKGITPLQPLLDEIAAIETKDDLIKMFGRAGREGLAAPIDGGIGIDRVNPDRYMVNIGQSGLTLPDRDYYLADDERFQTIRAAYESHVAEMLAFTGTDDTEEKAKNILALETEIATHHWPRTELRNRDKTYNVYTLAKLDEDYPGMDWKAFFEAGGITGLKELNVTTPSAIQPLIDVIDNTPIDTWKAWLTYKAVTGHAHLLSKEIDDADFAFFGKVLSGQPEQRPRWSRGVNLVGGGQGLGEAIGQVYVERYFPEDSKTKMVQLVENLREAYRRRIEQIDWMGEDTKKEAFDKLASFNPKIGYPDKWRDFSDVNIVPGELFKNAKAVSDFFYDDQIAHLNEPTDKDRWFMTPQTVNAYYNSSWNEIVFPAAILQPPFFDPNADLAVNYGGIGGVIGHEMGHGFDDQGSKSDAKGVQRNWWTDEDRANFDARTKSLGSQYDSYEPLEGQFVNGSLTMGENIGDLGGLSVAYEAYKIATEGQDIPVIDGLTGDQRFFLGWAQVWRAKDRDESMLRRIKSDPHSPAEFRVNGVVRNMDVWYDAFGVTEDDDLYLPPEERVGIW